MILAKNCSQVENVPKMLRCINALLTFLWSTGCMNLIVAIALFTIGSSMLLKARAMEKRRVLVRIKR